MAQSTDTQVVLPDIARALLDDRHPPTPAQLEGLLQGTLSCPLASGDEYRRLDLRGLVLRRLGRLPEALEATERAAVLSERKDFAVLVNLSRILRLMYRLGESLEVLGEAVDVAPEREQWRVLVQLGCMFAEVGANDDAEWAAKELLKTQGTEAHRGAASIFAMLGHHRKAVAVYAAALREELEPVPEQERMDDNAYLQAVDAKVVERLGATTSNPAAWSMRFAILWTREQASWVGGCPPRAPPLDLNSPGTRAALESQNRVFEETRYLRARANAAYLKD